MGVRRALRRLGRSERDLRHVASHAQHGEDVRLARALPRRGFYVDIGAGSPSLLSVTKLFYDRGWSGINVEPSAWWWSELNSARPRDVNLPLAISDTRGEIVLYDGEGEDAFFSTVEAGVAQKLEAATTRRLHPRVVQCITLADVFDQHVRDRVVDFMKIDVEGHERQVLVGNDWGRYRPRILVVESVEPSSTTEAHAAWEQVLVDAMYGLAAYDEVNRFYVRREDAALAPLLAEAAPS